MSARANNKALRPVMSGAGESDSRRHGRPLSLPGEKRDQGITVRFSGNDLALLRKRAAEEGMKIRPYLRDLILAAVSRRRESASAEFDTASTDTDQ